MKYDAVVKAKVTEEKIKGQNKIKKNAMGGFKESRGGNSSKGARVSFF
jgi:hypothetical protein